MDTLQAQTVYVESNEAGIPVSLVLPLLLREHGMVLEELAYILDVDETTAHRWQRNGWPKSKMAELTFSLGISESRLIARQDSLQRQIDNQTLVVHYEERDQRPETVASRTERLEAAGMVRLSTARPATYELYCFACGRGVGRGGTLISQRNLPKRTDPCRECQGTMFAREILTGNSERSYQSMDALLRESNAA